MKNFKKLIVWQRSMELASETNEIVSKLPKTERYTYRDQIIRSSILSPQILLKAAAEKAGRILRGF